MLKMSAEVRSPRVPTGSIEVGFMVGIAGRNVYLAGRAYVDGKREEARGRIEAARLNRERR